MKHVILSEASSYPVAIIIRESSLNQNLLSRHYHEPLKQRGYNGPLIGFSLTYNESGKAPVALIKEYVSLLLRALKGLGTNTLYVCDVNYFKVLTKQRTAPPHYGSVLPCMIKGYEDMKIILGVNHSVLYYDPNMQGRLNLTLDALYCHLTGTSLSLGKDIIKYEEYPESVLEIREALDKLHQYPMLCADIEAYSLKFREAGVASIGFAWSQHEGIAFDVDFERSSREARIIKQIVKQFLSSYQGKLVWHNCGYDLTVLIYQLWMIDLVDTQGLLTGLEVVTRNFGDTRIIGFLATNSTADAPLGLKYLAHEYIGNYAEDVKDIRLIPKKDLLVYNLKDCLATFYVFNKYYPIMVEDQQEEIYEEIMIPSLKVIIQMQLTGMPMDKSKVFLAKHELKLKLKNQLDIIYGSDQVNRYAQKMRERACEARNAKLKTKVVHITDEEFQSMKFNPGSPKQLQGLLYEEMELPVIDYTDTKQPATGAKTVAKLIHRAKEEDKELLQALIDESKISKLLSAFIPAFEATPQTIYGDYRLYGNFNLGGTQSARMSSSNVNLQQLPSTGSPYAKLIKSCFVAPEGWLFVGADFSSLEDRISALLTKDTNKLKVYRDFYDGHCLRAYSYFSDQMPDIDPDSVESINSIKSLYPDLRQDSKAPTFLLTYGGTWLGIENLGFPKEVAMQIESNYHTLYVESDNWVDNKIYQATIDGYVTGAFGLKIRTPKLAKTIMDKSNTPYEAQAEARSAGNAIGQSYGQLTNRACNEFMQRVWDSPYRLDILPCAQIHDAAYFLIKDSPEVIKYVNDHLIDCMSWQELPEIAHDKVKLEAELDVHYRGWHEPITLSNQISEEEIIRTCKAGALMYQSK